MYMSVFVKNPHNKYLVCSLVIIKIVTLFSTQEEKLDVKAIKKVYVWIFRTRDF